MLHSADAAVKSLLAFSTLPSIFTFRIFTGAFQAPENVSGTQKCFRRPKRARKYPERFEKYCPVQMLPSHQGIAAMLENHLCKE
jgi:hypothetical protein